MLGQLANRYSGRARHNRELNLPAGVGQLLFVCDVEYDHWILLSVAELWITGLRLCKKRCDENAAPYVLQGNHS